MNADELSGTEYTFKVTFHHITVQSERLKINLASFSFIIYKAYVHLYAHICHSAT